VRLGNETLLNSDELILEKPISLCVFCRAAARHDTPRAKVAAKPAAKKDGNGHANPEAVIPMNEEALKAF
jgi:hypothetical protein